ncbi:hypothetical protein MHK_004306 [Candidatus Magnetomorum sp. HK-1]|nr:hypothetical protein MHK_004306 [Candidatus Magnetomorum sp. HK-1]
MDNFLVYAKTNIVPIVPLIFPLVILSQILIQLLSGIGRKTKVKIYEAGRIEIGFSQMGPSISLLGTLGAEKKNAFISKIDLQVSRKNSSWKRTFEWRAFKPYTFSLIPQEENVQLESVSAFLLTTDNSFKYNIIFVDDLFIDEHYDKIVQIQTLWQSFREKHSKELTEKIDEDFETFYQQDNIQEIIDKIDKAFYWEPDIYNIEMCVHTQNPSKKFKSNYQTQIKEENIVKLKDNYKNIFKLACNLKANCKYLFLKYYE